MKLGVFDSGIGGEAVAKALSLEFPEAELLVVNDRDHVPYGSRTAEDIRQLTNTALQPLLGAQCDIIVIACNSATSAAIDWLREKYPQQLFIGLEPMVKPASEQTKSRVITVCATPATLAGDNYARLRASYASSLTVIEPDCSNWAKMIEDNDVNEEAIRGVVELSLSQDSDVIVLACTHYHWIKDLIESIVAGKATVLEPSEAVARRVRYLLSRPTAATN